MTGTITIWPLQISLSIEMLECFGCWIFLSEYWHGHVQAYLQAANHKWLSSSQRCIILCSGISAVALLLAGDADLLPAALAVLANIQATLNPQIMQQAAAEAIASLPAPNGISAIALPS